VTTKKLSSENWGEISALLGGGSFVLAPALLIVDFLVNIIVDCNNTAWSVYNEQYGTVSRMVCQSGVYL